MNRNDAEIDRTDRPKDRARGRFEKLLDRVLAAIRWPAPDPEALTRLSDFWQELLNESQEKRKTKKPRRDAVVIASLISGAACLLLALALAPWRADPAVHEQPTVARPTALKRTTPNGGHTSGLAGENGGRSRPGVPEQPTATRVNHATPVWPMTELTPTSPSRPATAADLYRLLLARARPRTFRHVLARPALAGPVSTKSRATGHAEPPQPGRATYEGAKTKTARTPLLRQHLATLVRRGRVDKALAYGVRDVSAGPILAEVLAAELSPLQLRQLLYRRSNSVAADIVAAALLQRDEFRAARFALGWLAGQAPARFERTASWCRKPCFKILLRIAATRSDVHRRTAAKLLQALARSEKLAAEMLKAAQDPGTALVAAGSAQAAGKTEILRRALAEDTRLRLLLRLRTL